MAGEEDPRPGLRPDVNAANDAYASGRDLYAARVINIHDAPTSAALSGAPARAWGNVPARNPAFTGREEHLAAIRATLLSGNRAAVQALHGIGGVGKTQLAIEYAHRFSDDYDIVWWLDTESSALFGQQYADLAVALGHAEPGTQQDVARRALLRHLHRQPRWLLIFDNAEDPGMIRDWLPSGPGHVLITSRSAGWGELALLVPVDVLSRDESVRLLRNWLPGLPAPDARDLATALGDLPLAIAQAAAYLAETRMRAAEYVALLEDHVAELLSESKPTSYRGGTLTAVTTLAHDRLRAADEDAAGLASICAFLAPEPIPGDWLATAASRLPDRLATRLGDPLERLKLLTTLTRTSLAHLDDDGLTMHRLTQAILRARTQPAAAIRGLAEAIVITNCPADAAEMPATWPAWARILPHLLALDPSHSARPGIRAAAAAAAWYLIASGNVAEAVALAQPLREQWRDRFGPDHPQALEIASALGTALRGLGRYEQARTLNADTLARRRALHGDDHPDTLSAASNLANDLQCLGQFGAARELHEDTFRRRQRVLGDDHSDTLRTADNLANDLHQLGDAQRARELHQDALTRRRRLQGDDHPDALRTANNLANDLHQLGDYHGARDLHQDTLTRRRRLQGDDHPDTLGTANNLAEDLRQLGDYHGARDLHQDTLTRRRRLQGDDHPDTLRSASNLAEDLRQLGEFHAARELDEDTLARRRRVLGEDHPHTRHSAQNLAEDLRALGETPGNREIGQPEQGTHG
jgi:hypothetical protein